MPSGQKIVVCTVGTVLPGRGIGKLQGYPWRGGTGGGGHGSPGVRGDGWGNYAGEDLADGGGGVVVAGGEAPLGGGRAEAEGGW